MVRYCLYCGRELAGDGEGPRALRAGVRIAFDPERGRVWTVCDRCHGWNLWPLDDRLEALEALERAALRGRLLYHTGNVALLEAGGREIIRVGATGLQEEAWWRYGRELRRRRARYRSRLSRLGAATYAAVSYVAEGLGLPGITGRFSREEDVYGDVLRWRRFGRSAWSGRAPCPNCRSVLIKLLFFKSRFLILLPGEEEELAIGVPCSRCDPWTIEDVHRLDGAPAERVLRRVLAYQNIEGASDRELERAVGMIEAAGSARALIRELTADPTSLHRLERIRTLALEISVNESAEREQLAREAAALEAGWRRAEELAAIVDEELQPG